MATRHELERLERLKYRLGALNNRILNAPEGEERGRNRAEASALEWAMDIVEKQLNLRDKQCYHLWTPVEFIEEDDTIIVICQRCLERRDLVGGVSVPDPRFPEPIRD